MGQGGVDGLVLGREDRAGHRHDQMPRAMLWGYRVTPLITRRPQLVAVSTSMATLESSGSSSWLLSEAEAASESKQLYHRSAMPAFKRQLDLRKALRISTTRRQGESPDMKQQDAMLATTSQFKDQYGVEPEVLASAPGRLEVLGNHTDYTRGLTLSCAVGLRCYAAIVPINGEHLHLASTMFDGLPQAYSVDATTAAKGHWTNYILGLVRAMKDRGFSVPGFALLVHSEVPRSAGVSSSAALEMAVVKALDALLSLKLPPLEPAVIGQSAESSAVGAQTGLLDQLSSLLGQRDHLLQIDFDSLQTKSIVIPSGWCFVAVDSGVKHDLTKEYNDRRSSCEAAAQAMGIPTLRQADQALLDTHRSVMTEEASLCAQHIIGENERVRETAESLGAGDMEEAGALMFTSHQSSQNNF